MLWAIANKAEKLWIKWMHEYYIKEQQIVAAREPADVTILFRKLLKCREWAVQEGLWEFDKSLVYNLLLIRQPGERVKWKELMRNSRATRRVLFCVWMALWGRLATKERLRKFQFITDM